MPKHILAVDDSKTMRDMVSITLREAGYTILEAEDGRHALDVLRGKTVDLVITDLNMPNMDGLTLIRNLRADPRHKSLPILMLTTEGDANKKNEGRAAGATGWLVKPFVPERLVDVVNRVCG